VNALSAGLAALLLLGGAVCLAWAAGPTVGEPVWTGDRIEAPLPGAQAGDVQRGRAVVESRQTGLCVLCHSLEAGGSPLQGNLAPPLAGSGARLTAGQLRARLVDSRRLQPQSIMPAYFVMLPADGGGLAELPGTAPDDTRFRRIATSWRGRTLLDAQQIEDVIAFLLTLREP
jgi:sulfur-oxidizing protein SoxX